MLIYISCHHPEPAEAAARIFERSGHHVVSTWHRGESPRPDRSDREGWGRKAAENFGQIDAADVLVLIAGPDRYPGGKFVEAGYALARGKRVVVVGDAENGMLWHPQVRHVASALEVIRN